MKKIYLLSAAVLCILAAASCEREISAPEGMRTTISASLESTKTALGDKEGTSWPNYWKAGDKISVNGVESDALDASADGQASAEFTFAGILSAPYYAVYPASAVSAYNAGTATVTVPGTQAYVAGSYDPAAFVMCGKSTDAAKVVLQPFVSIIHLSLTGSESISGIKLTGTADANLSGAFETDFSIYAPQETVSNIVELVPDSPVALPAEFFICVPAGLVGQLQVEISDANGGSMTKSASVTEGLSPGQMYSAPELAYAADAATITITAEGITSSTAVICWNGDPANAYTISVYADSACSSLIESFAVDAGNACWGGAAPRFCVSGFDPGTTYYVKVTSGSDESNVLPVTTADFTIVEVSDAPASVGTVLLAEDFGELRWDCDMIGNGAGFFPTSQDFFGNSEVLSYQAAATSNEKVLSSQADAIANSRLAHWAQGAKANLYIHPGYLKLVGSNNVTHLVTPALTNIPDGKVATLEVEVTASRYYSASSDSYATENAVVAVQAPDSYNELVDDTKTNTLDLTTNVQAITLPAETAWNTFKVTLTGVAKGSRIAFGAASDVTGNNARMNISDMKITLKALDDVSLAASLKSVSSSTASFTWTYGGEVANDVAKPYTIAVYSNAACTNLVVSHDFDADASCWGGRVPCFSIGGLAPSTTYWFVAKDTDNNSTSNAVEVTTLAFTPVDATTVTNAAAGDVILAEDFSEIGWGPEQLAVAAGFVPSTKNLTAPSGANPDGGYTVYDNAGNRIFGSGVDLGSSRLSKGWGFFGNSAAYLGNAYLRVASSTGRTHIVTPKLAGIPAGKVATIEVEVTASKYEANTNAVAVFVEKDLTMNGATDPGSSSFRKYTGVSFSNGHSLDITKAKEWETKSVTISNVDSECQLVIGSLEDISGKNRFFFSDIKVTITGLADDPVMKIKDEASFQAFVSAVAGGNKTVDAEVIASFSISSAAAASFASIEDYEGTLDGNGYTVSGLTKPLFNNLKGTVKDLTLNSTLNISADQADMGILANIVSGTVTGCTTKGSLIFNVASVVTGEHRIGGLAGSVAGSGAVISGCTNEASVTNATSNSSDDGELIVGGIVGSFWGTEFHVSDCENTGDITNTAYWNKTISLGGIVGQGGNSAGTASTFEVKSCTNSGTISNSGTTDNSFDIGGIAGYGRFLSMTDCSNSGAVLNTATGAAAASIYLGGLVGYVANDSASKGSSIDSGENEGAVSNYGNAGSVIELGGIAGYVRQATMTTLTNSGDIYNTGDASGEGLYLGGIIGYVERNCTMTETKATNSGAVTNAGTAKLVALGGVLGRNSGGAMTATGTSSKYLSNSGTISDESSSGGDDICVGGIVGYTTTGIKLQYARNTGAVQVLSGTYNCDVEIGGIAGWLSNNALNVNNCRNYGDITVSATVNGDMFAGGIVGLYHYNHKTDKYNLVFDATIDTHLSTVSGGNYTAGLFGANSDGNQTATYLFNGLQFRGTVIGNKTTTGLLCNTRKAGSTVTFAGNCRIAPGSIRRDNNHNDTVNDDSDLTMDIICGGVGTGSTLSGVSVVDW